MALLPKDRSLLALGAIVSVALAYAACGPQEAPSVRPTGCIVSSECSPSGSECLGGYCVPPSIPRECVNARQCVVNGWPSGSTCVESRCFGPPLDAPIIGRDVPFYDMGIPDAFVVADDDAPTSGAL